MKNYYKLLGLDKDAPKELISKVFKYHIKKNHPDLFEGDAKIIAENKVKELNEAYEILSDDKKREEYDFNLEQELNEKNEDYKSLDVAIIEEENQKLKHIINNYDRFFNEYMSEKIPYIKTIIDNYDNIQTNNYYKSTYPEADNYNKSSNYNVDNYNQNQNYEKPTFFSKESKDALIKIVAQIIIYFLIIFVLLTFFSNSTGIDVFEILSNSFLDK